MNKIIINTGLLIFCFALIYFSRLGMPVDEMLIRSAIVSIVIALILSMLTIILIKFINKTSELKSKEILETKNGK